jgi:hypothetical protein
MQHRQPHDMSRYAGHGPPGVVRDIHQRRWHALIRAPRRGSKSEHAHVAIGLLRRMQRRFDEASVAFEAAIALNRNSAVALFQLGLWRC